VLRRLILVQPPQRGLLNGFAHGLIDLANFTADRLPSARISILDLSTTSSEAVVDTVRATLASERGAHNLIGITTTTASYRSSLAVARIFKALDSDCLVVMGGHHASPQHDVILNRHGDSVDVVARGEGERALLNLMDTDHSLADIPGISYLTQGQLKVNTATPRLLSTEELNSLRVEYQGQTYQASPGKFDHVTYVSARGCPLHCSFCAVAGETIRAKSIDRVIQDLSYLAVDKGYQRIAIEDNFFAQAKKRTLALCSEIARLRQDADCGFTWDCQTRVESVKDDEMIRALEYAGCEAVYLGVEALTPAELLFLGKTSQPEHYLEILVNLVVPKLLDSTVDCYINIQVGLPGETSAARQERFARLSEIGAKAAAKGRKITVFPQLHVIYPGTSHFWKAVEQVHFGSYGAEVFEAFTEWEQENNPIFRFLGENFAHGIGGIPRGILEEGWLRRGSFEVSETSIDELRSHLSELATIDGIHMFKYGDYLTSSSC
jgi:radical SAM superfamily enzyme YgiQ (UPF0313 family)